MIRSCLLYSFSVLPHISHKPRFLLYSFFPHLTPNCEYFCIACFSPASGDLYHPPSTLKNLPLTQMASPISSLSSPKACVDTFWHVVCSPLGSGSCLQVHPPSSLGVFSSERNISLSEKRLSPILALHLYRSLSSMGLHPLVSL